ncbi:MAG TPA: hypothetical protein DCY13_14520 [Verrucomicrobiales bacterium]|nr:hypothetical protein [Verrucomicrobiales bacterium]
MSKAGSFGEPSLHFLRSPDESRVPDKVSGNGRAGVTTSNPLALMIVAVLLLLAIYLALGGCFAVWFCVAGVRRVDPHAQAGSWGFRCLIFPGATLLWPVLLQRVSSGAKHPPEERTAHRLTAGKGVGP